MSLKPVAGFRHFQTDHCVTGSMRHIYAFHGHDVSEDLLLGLGEGVGFGYFRFKGQPPFLGGRAQPKPSMEEIAARRTGVTIRARASSSDSAAHKALLERLEAGTPVMLQVDMGFLPYFDFGGEEYHFGGHAIVACGYDAATETVLVADRDKELHAVPVARLVASRGSRHKPFPPNRRWWELDFSGFRPPRAAEVLAALRNQAALMLVPPIANIGVKGIRKAAGEIRKWNTLLGADDLRGALFNAWIFLSAVGGSGGGAFRRMFSRFLGEAADISSRGALVAAGKDFAVVADAWDEIAKTCHAASERKPASAMAACLDGIAEAILAVADREEAAWTIIRKAAG